MALRKLGLIITLCIAISPSLSFGDSVTEPSDGLERRTAILEVKLDNALQLQAIAYQNGVNTLNTILSGVLGVFTVITGIFAFLGISSYSQMKAAQAEAAGIVAELNRSRDSIKTIESDLESLGRKYGRLVDEKVRELSGVILGERRDGFQDILDEKTSDAVIFVNENKQEPTVDERFLLAATHFRAGKYDEAEMVLKSVAEPLKESAKYWNALGLLRRKQENLKEAVKCFIKASDLAPNSWTISLNLALCLKDQGKASDALGLILARDLVSLSDGAWQVNLNLAAIFIDLGKGEEALEMLQQAEKTAKERKERPNGLISFNRACAYTLLGKREEAIHSLVDSVRTDGSLRELAETDTNIRSMFKLEELKSILG